MLKLPHYPPGGALRKTGDRMSAPRSTTPLSASRTSPGRVSKTVSKFAAPPAETTKRRGIAQSLRWILTAPFTLIETLRERLTFDYTYDSHRSQCVPQSDGDAKNQAPARIAYSGPSASQLARRLESPRRSEQLIKDASPGSPSRPALPPPSSGNGNQSDA